MRAPARRCLVRHRRASQREADPVTTAARRPPRATARALMQGAQPNDKLALPVVAMGQVSSLDYFFAHNYHDGVSQKINVELQFGPGARPAQPFSAACSRKLRGPAPRASAEAVSRAWHAPGHSGACPTRADAPCPCRGRRPAPDARDAAEPRRLQVRRGRTQEDAGARLLLRQRVHGGRGASGEGRQRGAGCRPDPGRFEWQNGAPSPPQR